MAQLFVGPEIDRKVVLCRVIQPSWRNPLTGRVIRFAPLIMQTLIQQKLTLADILINITECRHLFISFLRQSAYRARSVVEQENDLYWQCIYTKSVRAHCFMPIIQSSWRKLSNAEISEKFNCDVIQPSLRNPLLDQEIGRKVGLCRSSSRHGTLFVGSGDRSKSRLVPVIQPSPAQPVDGSGDQWVLCG